MSARGDGGAAFPGPQAAALVDPTGRNPPQNIKYQCNGMTLRDYFAAHCPVTLVEAGEKYLQNHGAGSFGDVLDYWSEIRWAYADSMIAEREVER